MGGTNLSNTKLIYLYRHGETNWNVEDRIMGQIDGITTSFTKLGYEQIYELSNKLRNNGVEAIYCSDYQRTAETARIANAEIQLPIYYCSEIRGLNMGKYQGMILDDAMKCKEIQSCFSNYDCVIENGESINQLNSRIENFIKKICNETVYKRIAIISHSAAISNLKAYLTNERYVSLNACTLKCDNNMLSVIDYEYNNLKKKASKTKT